MRFMRHGYEPGPGVCISSLAYDYPAAWRIPEHSHRSDQLIYATSGVMEVTIAQTHLLVPPLFAVWVSANTSHSIRMPCAVSMRTLYLRPKLVRARNCRVLHVAPLLRELILETIRIAGLLSRKRDHAALRDLLIAQIMKAAPIPTILTLPIDARARRVAEATLLEPAAIRKLDARCHDFGMSVRTLQRIFRRELGVDYDSWRRQVRLLKAIELLTTGTSIKAAAGAVGYRQASTFIAVFSRQFGLTPRAWIAVNSPKLAEIEKNASDTT
jgi:AraC-like DNA-binding protein